MTPLRSLQAFIRPSSTGSSIARQLTFQPERQYWLSRALAYIDEGRGNLSSIKGADSQTTVNVTARQKPFAAERRAMSRPEDACDLKWLMLMTCGQIVSPSADLSWCLEGASPWWRPLSRRQTSCPAYSSSVHVFTQAAVEPALEHDKEETQPQTGGDVYWLGRTHRDRDRYRDTASSFSAKAFYVGKDMTELLKSLTRAAQKQQLVTVWSAQDSKMMCLSPGKPLDGKDICTSATYLAIFNNMDTVVFFNGMGREVQLWKDLVGAFLPARNIEEFRVDVREDLHEAVRLHSDSIALRQAQPDQVKTIAYLLAQTVALHFYEMEVDIMLKVFQDMNTSMERTGEFGSTGAAGGSKADLLRMVASNNVMRTGILSSKIGLTKRFEAAWKDPECDKIYEHLRREMEIDRRYEALEDKFDLIQDNLKYFLEIIQNRKSDFLEYMIVLLIAAEICVSLFDMYTRV